MTAPFGYVYKKYTASKVVHVYQDGYNDPNGPVALSVCGLKFEPDTFNRAKKAPPVGARERGWKVCKRCQPAR
jgi:hypothetical protein